MLISHETLESIGENETDYEILPVLTQFRLFLDFPREIVFNVFSGKYFYL